MNRIIAPLNHTTQGTAVVDLHDALLLLIDRRYIFADDEGHRDEISAHIREERQEEMYLDATYVAVQAFQERDGLEPSGHVDRRTADALNTLLDSWGIFDTGNAPQMYIVSGHIRQDDGSPVRGVTVQAFHDTNGTNVRLGEDHSDAEGRYTIRYDPPDGRVVRLTVEVRDSAGAILKASATTATTRSIEIRDFDLPATRPPASKRQIEGRVVLEHGTSSEPLRVQLLRQRFGQEPEPVAETTTQAFGHYSLPYDLADDVGSLEIRVVGTGEPFSRALHDLGQAQRSIVHLVVPDTLAPKRAEYIRLEESLVPHIQAMTALKDAREDASRQDLTVLNRASGWDARVLALASTAAALSADPDVGLTQQELYGLFRAGLPSHKQQLAHLNAKTVQTAAEKAIAAGIIDKAVSVDAILAKFAAFSTSVRRKQTAPGGHGTYGDMLGAARLHGDNQTQKKTRETFETLFFEHQGTDGSLLWKEAEAKGIAPADIQSLQLQGKLGYLTGFNQPVVSHLQNQLRITNSAQLVDKNLHLAKQWEHELRALEAAGLSVEEIIPLEYRRPDISDPIKAYASDMALNVRLNYPTQTIAQRIDQDDLFSLGPARATLAKVLKDAAAKGYTIGQTPVDRFLTTFPEVMRRANGTTRETVAEQLKVLHRAYQITPSDEAMATLLNLGFTSAYDVVALPLAQFMDLYAHHFPSEEQARLIYRKAQQVYSVTYTLFTAAHQRDADLPMTPVAVPVADRDAVRTELVKHFPTLESLFGSMDFCECDHCRSVLSPAAYLIDLLQFLDKDSEQNTAMTWADSLQQWRTTHDGAAYPFRNPAAQAQYEADWRVTHPGQPVPETEQTPYAVLIARRPDLINIELTCANTNTAIPYIDVVNEILEYYVAHDGLDASAAHDTGRATSAELLAEPQHIEPAAYSKLHSSLYPLTLPFDLWLETVRQFCDAFEIPLWQLLEVLRQRDMLDDPTAPYDYAAIFTEYLGLSPAEYQIFTDPDPLKAWHHLYGYDDSPTAADAQERALDAMASAKALSRRLGIRYTELADIVRTEFVNPALGGLSVIYKLGITPGDVRHYRDSRALFETNRDLIGAVRGDLSDADKARYDALTPANWTAIHEVDAFVKRSDMHAAEYPSSGFSRAWLDTALASNAFDDVAVLVDPDAGCNFDLTTLQYAFRTGQARRADPILLLRINLFVRLWKALGWSIEEIDRALNVFIDVGTPFDTANLAHQPLKKALVSIAHLKALDARVSVGTPGRLKLLALWSPLATTGMRPLYAQLFLTRSVLKRDPVFDDAFGSYLSPHGLAALASARTYEVWQHNVASVDALDAGPFGAHPLLSVAYDPILKIQTLSYQGVLKDSDKAILRGLSASPVLEPLLDAVQQQARDYTRIRGHLPAIQGALELTADEIAAILTAAGLALETAPLDIPTLSILYRYRLMAKAVSLTVEDIIALKRLSGIDPFSLALVVPPDPTGLGALWGQALRFVELADQLKTAGFTIRDLAYLLHHDFDAAGPYNTDREPVSAVLAAIATGIRAIRAEHALPVDLTTVTEDMLRQKASLVLPADAVDMLVVRMRGELPLDNTFRAFFDTFLLKQTIGASVSGFLDAGDLNLLFAPLKPLVTFTPGDSPSTITRKRAKNAQIEAENAATLADRRQRLVQALLPYVQEHAIRQFVMPAVAGALDADASLVTSMLTETALIGSVQPDGTQTPLLHSFAAVEDARLKATFFQSGDLGNPVAPAVALDAADTSLLHADGTPVRPAGTRSVRFEGILQVPSTGPYQFFAVLDAAQSTATVQFDHLDTSVLDAVAGSAHDEQSGTVELKAGVLYRFTITLGRLGSKHARVLVQSATMPKGPLNQLTLFAPDAFAGAERAHLLLRKVLLLIDTLRLKEREIRYVATHAGDFGGLNFSTMPTALNTWDEARAHFLAVRRLADYVILRGDLAGGTDGLVDVYEARGTDAFAERLAQLSRRDIDVVKRTAALLPSSASLMRLWEALQAVGRFGVSPAVLEQWTRIVSPGAGDRQRFEIARDMKAALKARFNTEAWQRIAQPIFDRLRRGQRDALVAYIMHARQFERPDQLYEYFLIDPGMEPVVQTSRIRLAISSVQMFIQRSLLNMEPQVHPSVINSQQWDWMKRYRVWEANRKIFLYPENWLEPEFRDDKTHLYEKLEGLLLESDVSNDVVEDGFLQYLRGLEELARLNIVAMYCENTGDPARNVLHVVGRTYSEPHKYFYRRYVHRAWTPWVPIEADVLGDHLAPVVWRNRFYLFWLTFLDRSAPDGQPSSGAVREVAVTADAAGLKQKGSAMSVISDQTSSAAVTDLSLNEITNAVKKAASWKYVSVQLHWTEYLQGEWRTQETAGHAASLTAVVPSSFSPSSVFVHVSKEEEQENQERGVSIHVGGPIARSFYLAGRNSTPVERAYGPPPVMKYSAPSKVANRYAGSGPLTVSSTWKVTTDGGKLPKPFVDPRTIFGQGGAYTLLTSANTISIPLPADASQDEQQLSEETAALVGPVFYQDTTHTLFIEPHVAVRRLEDWQVWMPPPPKPPSRIDDSMFRGVLDLIAIEPRLRRPEPIDPDDPLWDPRYDPADFYVGKLDWLVNPLTLVQFGDSLMSASGREPLARFVPGDGIVLPVGETLIRVHTASTPGLGGTDLITALNRDRPYSFAGVNVLGSGGLTVELAENIARSAALHHRTPNRFGQ
jgi:hypothetical protein